MNPQEDRLLCQVYRSNRRADTYLFTERTAGLSRVPPALLEMFGEPEPVLTFKLFPGRRLAQADPAVVLAAIGEQGFYLQLPPSGNGDETVQGADGAD